MEIAVFVFGILFIVLIAISIVAWRLGTGTAVAATEYAGRDVLDEVQNYFVSKGWRVEGSTPDSRRLKRPPDGCTALFFLVVFLPLGILYLLTGWGDGEIGVDVEEMKDGDTFVRFSWRNAIIRQDIDKLVDWLEPDGEEPSD